MPRVATKRVTKRPALVKKKTRANAGPGNFYLYAHYPKSHWNDGDIVGNEMGYATQEKAEAAVPDLVDDVDQKATIVVLQKVKEYEAVEEDRARTVIDKVLVLKAKPAVIAAVR